MEWKARLQVRYEFANKIAVKECESRRQLLQGAARFQFFELQCDNVYYALDLQGKETYIYHFVGSLDDTIIPVLKHRLEQITQSGAEIIYEKTK